jgi:hypothetical protein
MWRLGFVPPSTHGKGAAGGSSGPNGQPAGPVAAGNLTTAAGSGLPLPRSELLLAGKSIVRSMRRVTHGTDQIGKGAGDADGLMSDADRIGALASILAPATGLASLASGASGAGTDAVSAAEVVDRLRLNFGQLGYMQGVLDENLCQVDGQLEGPDGFLGRPAAHDEPGPPADPASLTDDELREARAVWSARADLDFDALIRAQEEMSDLDDRRRNLDHQVDAVSDLLARLDDAGTAPVPRHLGDTLCYGLGWHLAGDPPRMWAALRESRSRVLASAGSAPAPKEAPVAARASASAPSPRATPFAEWAAANKTEGGSLAILQVLAGLERWCGFYDALTGTLQRHLLDLRVRADTTSAACRSLSAELQRRTLGGREG